MSEEIKPLIEENVSEETYELCVKVGMQMATDKDYFQICLNALARQQAEQKNKITTA